MNSWLIVTELNQEKVLSILDDSVNSKCSFLLFDVSGIDWSASNIEEDMIDFLSNNVQPESAAQSKVLI